MQKKFEVIVEMGRRQVVSFETGFRIAECQPARPADHRNLRRIGLSAHQGRHRDAFSPLAIRTMIASVGLFSPRSTLESMARLTPDCAANSSSVKPACVRRRFTRPPTSTTIASSFVRLPRARPLGLPEAPEWPFGRRGGRTFPGRFSAAFLQSVVRNRQCRVGVGFKQLFRSTCPLRENTQSSLFVQAWRKGSLSFAIGGA